MALIFVPRTVFLKLMYIYVASTKSKEQCRRGKDDTDLA